MTKLTQLFIDLPTTASVDIPTPQEGNMRVFIDTDGFVKAKDSSGSLLVPSPALIGALALPQVVSDVTALNAAASGSEKKFLLCQSDPSYSTDPTLNFWDGNGNLIVFAGEKRN